MCDSHCLWWCKFPRWDQYLEHKFFKLCSGDFPFAHISTHCWLLPTGGGAVQDTGSKAGGSNHTYFLFYFILSFATQMNGFHHGIFIHMSLHLFHAHSPSTTGCFHIRCFPLASSSFLLQSECAHLKIQAVGDPISTLPYNRFKTLGKLFAFSKLGFTSLQFCENVAAA